MRLFDDVMFKKIKSWDLRMDVDDVNSKFIPLILEYIFTEATHTRTLQLWSHFCTPLDLLKKHSREVTDKELQKMNEEELEQILENKPKEEDKGKTRDWLPTNINKKKPPAKDDDHSICIMESKIIS